MQARRSAPPRPSSALRLRTTLWIFARWASCWALLLMAFIGSSAWSGPGSRSAIERSHFAEKVRVDALGQGGFQ